VSGKDSGKGSTVDDQRDYAEEAWQLAEQERERAEEWEAEQAELVEAAEYAAYLDREANGRS
jgi:hypothetical protein